MKFNYWILAIQCNMLFYTCAIHTNSLDQTLDKLSNKLIQLRSALEKKPKAKRKVSLYSKKFTPPRKKIHITQPSKTREAIALKVHEKKKQPRSFRKLPPIPTSKKSSIPSAPPYIPVQIQEQFPKVEPEIVPEERKIKRKGGPLTPEQKLIQKRRMQQSLTESFYEEQGKYLQEVLEKERLLEEEERKKEAEQALKGQALGAGFERLIQRIPQPIPEQEETEEEEEWEAIPAGQLGEEYEKPSQEYTLKRIERI